MADRYFDLNGSTAGFGTLTGAWDTTSAFWNSSSAGGPTAPTAFTFTNLDRAFFGAASATATAGTATIADGVTVTLNGITTANLAGLQTITRTTSGALAFAGTTPSLVVGSAGGLTISAPVAFNAATTVNNSSTVTLSGQLTGSGTLTKSGSGTLFLTNTGTANSNTGAVTISAGDAYCLFGATGTPNQLAAVTGTISVTGTGRLFFLGGTAQAYTQTFSGNGKIFIGNPNITFSGAANMSGLTGIMHVYTSDVNPLTVTSAKATFDTTASFPSALFGFDRVTYATGSTTTITYTGSGNVATTGYWGHFSFNAAATSVFQHYATGGATFTMGGSGTWVSTDAGNDTNLQYDVGSTAGALTISIPLREFSTGKFTLTKLGTGVLTLTGDNQISKAITVSAGTLNANSATALGAASSMAGISVSSGATLSLGAALNYSSPGRSTSIIGTGVGGTAGALVHAFAGTANVGAITLGAASYVRGTATGTLSSTFALGANRLTAGAASGVSFTLSGTLTSTFPAGLTVGGQASDTGTVVVSGSNTLPGAFFVNYGTLSTQNAQALGVTNSAISGTVDTGATLSIGVLATYTGSITLNGSIVIAHSGASNLGTITSNFNTSYVRGTVLNAALASPFSVISDLTFGAAASASLALTGVINSSASNVVVNVGQQVADTGTVFFNANNTYAGTTTLAYGTAQVVTNQNGSVSGPLGKSGTIKFTGGTLQYSATNQFDYSPRLDTTGSQQWKIDTNGQTVTFATVLQGASSSLTKSGTGTLKITGTNTYTGSTSVSAGTLAAGNTQAFGTTGTVTLTTSGATLQTLTTGGQNGKLTVANLTNSAGGTIRIGG